VVGSERIHAILTAWMDRDRPPAIDQG
jgi:hypothetical protein